MPIPVGTYYQKKELGNGTVATIENNVVDTVTAGEEINFGVAVNVKDGKAVTATSAPILGIAIKRDYIDGDDYNALPDDKFKPGEKIAVLRKGGISVPITTDVSRYDFATVNSDGTFKTAGAGDGVVGRFKTDGYAGKTAIVQVELTDMVITAPASDNSGSNNNQPTTKQDTQPTTTDKGGKQ